VTSAADIRDTALLSGAVVLGTVVAPTLLLLGVPMASAGVAGLLASGRVAAAAFAAGLAVALAAFLAPADAVLLIPALTAVLIVCVRLREHSALQGVAILTAVLGVSAAAADATRAWLGGTTLLQQRAEMAEGALELARAMSGAGDDALAGFDSATIIDTLTRMWPADYFFMGALTAVLGIAAAGWAGSRAGSRMHRFPALSELDLSPHVLWLFVGGLLLLAAGRMMDGATGLAWIAGANLLAMARLPLFAQGLGVVSALYRRAGLGRVARGIGYALLAVVDLLVPVVSLVGLVDFWANLRRLPREESRESADSENDLVGRDEH